MGEPGLEAPCLLEVERQAIQGEDCRGNRESIAGETGACISSTSSSTPAPPVTGLCWPHVGKGQSCVKVTSVPSSPGGQQRWAPVGGRTLLPHAVRDLSRRLQHGGRGVERSGARSPKADFSRALFSWLSHFTSEFHFLLLRERSSHHAWQHQKAVLRSR